MGHSFRDTEHTRLIARRWHHVGSQVSDRFAVLLWVPTNFMLSDILAKALKKHALTYVLFCAICQYAMDPSLEVASLERPAGS
jgi:hypothetical protein